MHNFILISFILFIVLLEKKHARTRSCCAASRAVCLMYLRTVFCLYHVRVIAVVADEIVLCVLIV